MKNIAIFPTSVGSIQGMICCCLQRLGNFPLIFPPANYRAELPLGEHMGLASLLCATSSAIYADCIYIQLYPCMLRLRLLIFS